jgi:quinohemoprotein ethanol dehydrogenase
MTIRLASLVVAAGLLAATMVALASAAKAPKPKTETANSYLPAGVAAAGNDWPEPYGETSNTMYSTLTQINTGNVSTLRQVWQDQFPGASGQGYQEHVPLVISGAGKNLPLESGTMFLSQITGLVALDPTNGQILWRHDGPHYKTEPGAGPNSQGRTARVEAYGNGMVFVGQQDGSLAALDAKSGAQVWSNSSIAGGAGLISNGTFITHTNAQPFAKFVNYGKDGLVLSGITGGDSAERGHMDAFNARTGSLVWRFWTTPDPTQAPFILTWADPAGAAYGGGALWSQPAVDPSLGLVYFGTGNVYPYTGRAPGKNLWTDSEIAVDYKTGKLRWYFQQVHHDLWDYDVPSPANLFNANIGGKLVPVIAEGGKTGYMYVLNRVNGRTLKTFPIPEVAVPNLNGGKGAALNNTWPTQPEPQGGAGQIVPMCMDDASLRKAGFDPSLFGAALKYPGFPLAPNGTPIIPTCPFAPSYNDAYLLWGASQTSGAMNWQPTSYSPQTNDQYICAQVDSGARENASPVSSVLLNLISEPRAGIVPGVAGTLVALNMGTNKIDWRVNYMGATSEDCYSGTLATAGGLVFTADRGTGPFSNPPGGGTIYAYDAKNGKQLWSWQNPGNDFIEAPPITYSVKGKQYLAEVVQGPPSDLATRDRLTVFAL